MLHDHCIENGRVYTVAECLAGGDLFTHISQNVRTANKYTVAEVQKMMQWMVEGTKFLHQNGIAHQDLKPENIMGGIESGYLKLVDFGTAKLYPAVKAANGSGNAIQSVRERPRGPVSPPYTAREQAEGNYNPFLADVYSLGCILSILCTGKVPPHSVADFPQRVATIDTAARTMVLNMVADEASRWDCTQVSQDPWLSLGNRSNSIINKDTFDRLIDLSQKKYVTAEAGKFFLSEVGTDGTHLAQEDGMCRLYESPRDLNTLTDDEKKLMPYWQKANKAGMKLYTAKDVKTFVEVTEGTMAEIEKHFKHFNSLVRSKGDGVHPPAGIQPPSNKEVADFVTQKIQQGHPHFRVTLFRKLGVFARQLQKNEQVVLKRSQDNAPAGTLYFMYKSPTSSSWSAQSAHQHMKIRTGDAFAYKPKESKVYTMEHDALVHNHQPVRTSTLGPEFFKPAVGRGCCF